MPRAADGTGRRTAGGAPGGRRPALALGLLLVLAAAVRLAVFAALPGTFDFVRTGAVHGSEAYDRYATNLLETGTYGLQPGVPDAAVPPAYGFVLAAAYAVLGRSAATVAALHTAFDLVAIALLAAIGGRLTGRPEAGLLAGLGMALYPYLVFQSLAVNDTALFILELHALVWLAVLAGRRPAAGVAAVASALLAGAVLGVGVLTRPVLAVVAAAVGLWLWRRAPREGVPVRLAAVALAAAAVPLAAWGARNLAVLGQPVLVATNGGSNFWQGNNPETVRYLRAGWDVQWIPPGELGELDFRDPDSNRVFLAAGLRFLRDNPGRIPELAWTKLRTQWSLDVSPRRNPVPAGSGVGETTGELGDTAVEPAIAAYSSPLFDRLGRAVHRATWGAALVLAALGVAVSRPQWRELSLVAAVEVAMTAFYLVFHPSTRYRLPGDPLLFVVSAVGLLAVAETALRAWRRGRR